MTDLPASWQPDPTGRHDHRYWDGTIWTDHVADAGVAATDPYRAPATTPEPTPWRPRSPFADGSAAISSTDADRTSADPERGSGPERDADPASAPGTTSGSAEASSTPTQADRPTQSTGLPTGWGAPPASADPSSPSPAGTAGLRTGWGDAPTQITPGVSGDAPTEITPATGWPTAAAPAGSGEPTGDDPGAGRPDGPTGPEATGDGSGRRRSVAVAVAVAVVVAVVAVLAIAGSDSNGREAVKGRIIDSLRDSEPALSEKDAECMADHIVDEVGADRLKDVDFTADQAPGGELGTDLVGAYSASTGACDVSDDSFGGASPGTSDGSGGFGDLGDITDIDNFKDLLAQQYAATLGLSTTKARCLADALGEAVREGKLNQEDAFGDLFSYLDTCDISLDELTSGPG